MSIMHSVHSRNSHYELAKGAEILNFEYWYNVKDPVRAACS